MDIFDSLQSINGTLGDWIVHVSPSSQDEAELMSHVMVARDRLVAVQGALVASRPQLAPTPSVVEAQLEQIATQLTMVQRTASSAQIVLPLAEMAAQVASTIAAIIGGGDGGGSDIGPK